MKENLFDLEGTPPPAAGGGALPLRNPVFLFAISLSFLNGLVINLLPVTFKVFSRVFHVGYEKQGGTESLYFVGGLIGCLAAGFLAGRIGIRRFTRVGLLVAAAGLFLIGAARVFLMVQAGALLMGLGCIWLGIAYNAVVAFSFQHIRQKVFAAVMLVMAIGGTLGPMGLGSYISYAWLGRGWPWWIPYVALAVCLCGYVLVVPSLPSIQLSMDRKGGADARLRHLLRSPVLWLIGLLTVLHGIGQIGAVVWLARLYEIRLGLPESQVGMMISGNILGFITGRIILTRFGGRLPDRVLLGCSAAVGSICYVLTILSPSLPLGMAFMYVAGLGMSGDAVSLQSFTALRFRDAAPKAFAFTQALNNIGAASGPYIIGFLGDRTGTLEHAVWLVPISIGLLSLSGFAWHLADRAPEKSPALP